MHAFSNDFPRAREHDTNNSTRHTHPTPAYLAYIHIRRSPVCSGLASRAWLSVSGASDCTEPSVERVSLYAPQIRAKWRRHRYEATVYRPLVPNRSWGHSGDARTSDEPDRFHLQGLDGVR